MTIYIAGVDLAETLAFFACTVVAVEGSKIKIKTVIKKNEVLYPELETLMLEKVIAKYGLKKIVVDYTSEKAFSEFLERRLHPSFANPSSPQYKKWKYVTPIIMNDTMKLNMKQNARQMMDADPPILEWPPLEKIHPTIAKRIEELREQLLRETGQPSKGAVPLRFPKPEGEHNDLAVSLELALLEARNYLGRMSGSGGIPIIIGKKISPEQHDPTKPFLGFVHNITRGLDVKKVEFKRP